MKRGHSSSGRRVSDLPPPPGFEIKDPDVVEVAERWLNMQPSGAHPSGGLYADYRDNTTGHRLTHKGLITVAKGLGWRTERTASDRLLVKPSEPVEPVEACLAAHPQVLSRCGRDVGHPPPHRAVGLTFAACWWEGDS